MGGDMEQELTRRHTGEAATTTATTTTDAVSEENSVTNGSNGDDDASGKKKNPMDDPMYYNRWNLIFSRPFTKPKMLALARELLSGLTVALAQVPEAVAFALTAGVPPLVGLQAAWIIGIVTAAFGGAPGMVSGATGALAVVLPPFVKEYGLGYLFIAVFLMGWIQIIFGLVGGGALIKLVGHPVMLGFVNGLGIVIGVAQLHSFQDTRYCVQGTECANFDQCPASLDNTNSSLQYEPCYQYVTGAEAGFQALIVIITMATIQLVPKCTKSFPSSLAGIIVGTIVEFAVVRPSGFATNTVGDIASVEGTFPIPIWLDDQYAGEIPSLGDLETYKICLPLSAVLAVIGLVESLMTMRLVGEITDRPPSALAECLAQGVGNVLCGIGGSMGGCAMIGQSMINVKSGGITRISTSFAALFLLFIILVASPLIELIPVAALAGVMFNVVYHTIDWHSIPLALFSFLPESIRHTKGFMWLRKIKRSDALIILMVTIIAVVSNLAIAVGAGVVFACIVFSWDQEHMFSIVPVDAPPSSSVDGSNGVVDSNLDASIARIPTNGSSAPPAVFGDKHSSSATIEKSPSFLNVSGENSHGSNSLKLDPKQVKVYQVKGPLYFASAQTFISSFKPAQDPDTVILYLDQTVLSDYSAMVAINQVARSYQDLNKKFLLRKVTNHSLRTIRKAKYLIYTYDKEQTESENEDELINMAIAPFWQAADVPIYHDSSHQETQIGSQDVETGTADANGSTDAKSDQITGSDVPIPTTNDENTKISQV